MYDRYYQGEKCICCYFHECSTDKAKGYNSSHAVKVGKNYDLFIDGKPIRILFMGKESPADKRKDKVEETEKLADCLLNNGSVNPHYLKTYMMLCDMLNYNPPNVRPYRNREDAVLSFFSLINRYRCAIKEKGQRSGVKNTSKQYEHCLKILQEEIRIMEPTILVLQHKYTKADKIFDDTQLVQDFGDEKIFHSPKYDCYVIETVHPCIRDGSWPRHCSNLQRIVNRLKQEKALPTKDCDITDELNRIVREQA